MKIKIMKKVMSVALCALAAFTCFIGPIQTKAATSTEDWRIGIRLKLRAKNNYFYKDWWQIDLVCRDGILSLEGKTNIPSNLMFDDVFVIGYNDSGPIYDSTWHPFTTYDSKSASYVLQKEMAEFNASKVEVGEPIIIHGYYWDGTLRFADTDGVIKQISNNDYSKGYKTVDKWKTGFMVTKEGLTEIGFIQSKDSTWERIQLNKQENGYTGVPVSY